MYHFSVQFELWALKSGIFFPAHVINSGRAPKLHELLLAEL